MRSILAGLLVALGALAAQAAPPTVQWDLADHGPQMIVSGGSITLSSSSTGWETARSLRPQSSGMRTVHIAVDNIGGGQVAIGIANGKTQLVTQIGQDINSVGYLSTGNTLANGAWGGDSPGPYTTGDVVGVRVDFAAHTVKFQRNGGKWSFPMSIALLGPDAFVAVSMQYGVGPAPQLHVASDDWSDFSEPTLNLIAVGDSISLTGGVMRTYLPRLAEMIRIDRKGWARTHRFAVNGASWDFAWEPSGYPYTLAEDMPRRVVPALSPTLPNWVIAFAGTNGIALARRDADYEYSRLQAYVSALNAAGVPASQIVVPTMLPRGGIPESTRAAYNAAIVADPARLGYRVARLDLDPDVGAAGQVTNPNWYRDGVHPTDAGHEAIARIIYATMFP